MPGVSKAEQVRRQGGIVRLSDYTVEELTRIKVNLERDLDKVVAELARRHSRREG